MGIRTRAHFIASVAFYHWATALHIVLLKDVELVSVIMVEQLIKCLVKP